MDKKQTEKNRACSMGHLFQSYHVYPLRPSSLSSPLLSIDKIFALREVRYILGRDSLAGTIFPHNTEVFLAFN